MRDLYLEVPNAYRIKYPFIGHDYRTWRNFSICSEFFAEEGHVGGRPGVVKLGIGRGGAWRTGCGNQVVADFFYSCPRLNIIWFGRCCRGVRASTFALQELAFLAPAFLPTFGFDVASFFAIVALNIASFLPFLRGRSERFIHILFRLISLETVVLVHRESNHIRRRDSHLREVSRSIYSADYSLV
jgi:hypothetical protein